MCYDTDGPNTVICEIDINIYKDWWCGIECELKSDGWHCVQQCHHTGIACASNITNDDFISYCCKESLCNNFTDVNFSPSQPTQTPSPSGK